MPIIARYPFDGNVRDRSGANNDGTPTDITYDTGQFGQAASLNGTTSKIDCNSDFLVVGDLTICMWVKLSGWGGGNFSRLITNGRVELYTRTTGALTFFSANGAGGSFTQSANGAVSLGSWFFVVVTRDAGGLVNFFINAESNGPTDQDSSPVVSGTTNVIIGNNNGSTRGIDGLLDEGRIHNGVLSGDDIRLLFNHNYLRVLALSV